MEFVDYTPMFLIGVYVNCTDVVWDMYTQEVLEHFDNPSNVGTIVDADGVATIGSASSGEMIKLTLRIVDDIVIAAKICVFGCPTLIACGSVLTELVSGRPILEVKTISSEQISEALGGIPEDKLRFTVYAENVLKTAIEDALSKQERKK